MGIILFKFYKKTKVVNEVLDISTKNHMSERMALIYNRLTNDNLESIKPMFGVGSKKKQSHNTLQVYFNTVAGEEDRCLSEEQVNAVIEYLESKNIKTFVYSEFTIKENAFITKIKNTSFSKINDLISCMDFVITPDTSITHLASLFNIPAIVLFCGGENDYYNKCTMAETWAPLNRISIIIEPEVSSFNNKEPVSKIKVEVITNSIKNMLDRIKK